MYLSGFFLLQRAIQAPATVTYDSKGSQRLGVHNCQSDMIKNSLSYVQSILCDSSNYICAAYLLPMSTLHNDNRNHVLVYILQFTKF